MKKIIRIILPIFFLISCKNSEKAEGENNYDSISENTQTEFKKVESNNSLNLEYQLLGENGLTLNKLISNLKNTDI